MSDHEQHQPCCQEARVATAVAGSGGPHSAASSNMVDEVESSSSGVAQSAAAKQLPSHAGRVLNTGSSDVPQLPATCQEPRSTMVFMEIHEPIWAIEVTDGQKLFECIAAQDEVAQPVQTVSLGRSISFLLSL